MSDQESGTNEAGGTPRALSYASLRRVGRSVLLAFEQPSADVDVAAEPSPRTEGGDTQGLVGESQTYQPESGEA